MNTGTERIKKLFADFERASKINETNLLEIIRAASDTDFGKTAQIDKISSVKEYQKAIPLSKYADYKQDVRYTTYPEAVKLLTSGTAGKQKEIMLSEEALNRYADYIYQMPYYLTGTKEEPNLHASIFGKVRDGKSILSSAYFHYLERSGMLCGDDFLGKKELLFGLKTDNIPYFKVRLALSCPHLKSLQSIFLYDILLLMGYMEENWEMILDDMQKGDFSVSLAEPVKEELGCITPNEEELARLRSVFKQGFDTPIVPRLWKQLRFISGIGGKSYAHFNSVLKGYTGSVPIYYFSHASSECMMGIAVEMDKAEYALLPYSAFYELLDENGNVFLPSEAKIGKCYELVITTFSGLYRYRTMDLIEVVSFLGETPVYIVLGRKNRNLNIAGEKIGQADFMNAAELLSEQTGMQILDFSVGIDTSCLPNRYVLFAETDDAISQKAALYDEILKKLSPDYEELRELMMIRPPQIVRMGKGEISVAITKAKHADAHNKPHMLLTDEQTEALLERYNN